MPDRSVSSELNIPTTIYETLRPHQIEALEFLWEKLVTKGICTTDYLNNAAKLASTEVFGAILGHSMGLGKTLTTLTFLILVQDYVRRCSSSKADGPSDVCPNLRVLVVAPRSIVEHWQESAVDWLTPAFLGDSSPPPLFVPALSPDTQSILINFYMQGGLLALGYEEYVRLVQSAREQPTILDCKPVRSMLAECGFKKDYMYSNYTLRNIAGKDFTDKVCTIEILEDADIVVLDEAHRLRRATSKSVQNLSYHLRRVPIRLALTGTPLQNHLQDYNVMLSVVTGSTVNARQFSTLFVKPIQKGQSVDASYHQFLEMQKCVASMRQYFGKFVHYCGPKVLEEYLPPRMEYVFFVELSPEQEARYKKILEEVPRTTKDGLALVIHHNLSHVCLHPYLCRSDASSYTQVGGGGSPRLPNDGLDDDPTAFDAPDVEVENTITSIEDIALSPKLHFALQLTQHITKVRGEKVVIFSHYISHLVLVKELLCQFYQIDSAIFSGSLSPSDRGALIRRFKESGSLKVLLCSVRAGGVGIDLCAANHCILLDVSWNPTDDAQATYRIYRFGQKKTVYVYRLACTGTTEHVVFSYSLQKTWLHRKIEDVIGPHSSPGSTVVEVIIHLPDQGTSPNRFPPGEPKKRVT
ncbi:RAD54-like protein 2 [Angomonas deanei]|nr:RAD54-like protein 2 [Angomonas deanei]|eukprot:EPY40447.1 RAD54-like protein 2 [Angomonas deanei]